MLLTPTHAQVFTWQDEAQNVVAVQQQSCQNVVNGVELATAAQDHAEVELAFAGTFYFTSTAADQCQAGMLMTVKVSSGDMLDSIATGPCLVPMQHTPYPCCPWQPELQ